MLKTSIKFVHCLFVFTIFWNGYGAENDSSFVLIVNPNAEIYSAMDRSNPVDVKIQYYERRFPKDIYDYLAQRKGIDLRTQFDELVRLKEQITDDSREGFIKGIDSLISFTPNAYVFTSIDKSIDKVILRAEMLDLSTKSLAVAERRIAFSKFLDDNALLNDIKSIGNSLMRQIFSSHIAMFRKIELWSGVLTAASAIWWLAENHDIGDAQDKYNEASSLVAVQEARENAIGEVKDRDRARSATFVLASATVAIAVYEILLKPIFNSEKGTLSNRESNVAPISINPYIQNGTIAFQLSIAIDGR